MAELFHAQILRGNFKTQPPVDQPEPWNRRSTYSLVLRSSLRVNNGPYSRKRNNAGFRLRCRSPLCRYAAWSSLAVSELQLSAATPLWLFTERQSLPELNRIQLSAICRGGQSGKVIDLLAWRCLPLGHPSAASDACAVVQISSSKRQCGKRQVSLKPALL